MGREARDRRCVVPQRVCAYSAYYRQQIYSTSYIRAHQSATQRTYEAESEKRTRRAAKARSNGTQRDAHASRTTLDGHAARRNATRPHTTHDARARPTSHGTTHLRVPVRGYAHGIYSARHIHEDEISTGDTAPLSCPLSLSPPTASRTDIRGDTPARTCTRLREIATREYTELANYSTLHRSACTAWCAHTIHTQTKAKRIAAIQSRRRVLIGHALPTLAPCAGPLGLGRGLRDRRARRGDDGTSPPDAGCVLRERTPAAAVAGLPSLPSSMAGAPSPPKRSSSPPTHRSAHGAPHTSPPHHTSTSHRPWNPYGVGSTMQREPGGACGLRAARGERRAWKTWRGCVEGRCADMC